MNRDTQDPTTCPADHADELMAHLDALGWALLGILLAAILTGCVVALVLASLRMG